MKIQSTTNNGIQYHILKTAHKDFVTGLCSIPMGTLYADFDSRHLPKLLASMLSLGTKSKTEEELNELLESKGIQMYASASNHYITINFTCLTKYLDETIALVAEQFKEPRFDKTSFEHLKQRFVSKYGHLKDDTGYRAQVVFSQEMFPSQHIACMDDTDVMIDLIEKTDIDSIKQYHQDYLNFGKAEWIMVGDVLNDVPAICEKYMPLDEKSTEIKRLDKKAEIESAEKKVSIQDKQSVDFVMGHVINVDRKHPDYLPLALALDALGGSFSARLMRTVRDEDGLTYNVGSSMASGINGSQCYWTARGSFSPKLLDQGIKAIEHQLKLWVGEGLTEEEFLERKTGLLGKYQVKLSDANVLTTQIARSIEQGFDANYLYTYCDEIEKITLEDVNRVIKKYIQLDKVIKVSAGSV